MEIIEIKTLLDITNSKVARNSVGNEQEHNQYKNWITFLQCIGLRSIILYDNDPLSEIVDVKNLKFGSKHKGKHQVWTFRFTTDRSDCYTQDGNKVKLLIDDLHEVPVIEKLTETINISKAVFDLQNPQWKNTTVDVITIPEENTDVENN